MLTRDLDSCLKDKLKFEALGAQVFIWPCIKIKYSTIIPDEPKSKTRYPQQFDWVIFTSQHAVKALDSTLSASPASRDSIAIRNDKVKYAVIGPRTKNLFIKLFHQEPDFMPSKATAKCLAKELPAQLGDKILLPQSNLTRPELKNILGSRSLKLNLTIKAYTAYENILDNSKNFQFKQTDFIYFASPSAVKNFFIKLKPQDKNNNLDLGINKITALCIGPTTLKAAQCFFSKTYIYNIL